MTIQEIRRIYVVKSIILLATNRKWFAQHPFCVADNTYNTYNNCIVINCENIEIYRQKYEQGIEIETLDKWLLEIIRKEIPNAKRYKFWLSGFKFHRDYPQLKI